MKYKMEQLINRSYEAIKSRGLIKEDTHIYSFLMKMDEEYAEVTDACDLLYAFNNKADKDHYVEECIDLATVCFMQILHLGYDPIKEFEKVVLKNEKRVKEL